MKRFLLYGLISLIVLTLIIVLCNTWVLSSTKKLAFEEINEVPSRDVALVLGTIKELQNGRENLYFSFRINAAAELYKAGKVKHIIVSGDNHKRGYNEPEDMQLALIKKGVPSDAITLDFAGFRTLDSVVRAKEIFQQDRFIIVSQAFHNYRALFIAQKYGIDAVAYNAQKVTSLSKTKIAAREILARVKAVLDLYVLRKQPKFFGEKIDLNI